VNVVSMLQNVNSILKKYCRNI